MFQSLIGKLQTL